MGERRVTSDVKKIRRLRNVTAVNYQMKISFGNPRSKIKPTYFPELRCRRNDLLAALSLLHYYYKENACEYNEAAADDCEHHCACAAGLGELRGCIAYRYFLKCC